MITWNNAGVVGYPQTGRQVLVCIRGEIYRGHLNANDHWYLVGFNSRRTLSARKLAVTHWTDLNLPA